MPQNPEGVQWTFHFLHYGRCSHHRRYTDGAMVFWRDRIIHSQWGRAGRANVAWRLIQKMWKDKLRSWVNLGQLEVSVWFWATCIYSSMGDYIWRIMIICLRFDFFSVYGAVGRIHFLQLHSSICNKDFLQQWWLSRCFPDDPFKIVQVY